MAQKAKQSRTLKDAIRSYRKRYKRYPPPGFDEWYHFARHHNSSIIDDFDQIDEDLAPFRNEGNMIKQRIAKVHSTGNGRGVAYLVIENGKLSILGARSSNALDLTLIRTLSSISYRLPDLVIPLNWSPLPYVLPSKVESSRERTVPSSKLQKQCLLQLSSHIKECMTNVAKILSLGILASIEAKGSYVTSKVPVLSSKTLRPFLDITAPFACPQGLDEQHLLTQDNVSSSNERNTVSFRLSGSKGLENTHLGTYLSKMQAYMNPDVRHISEFSDQATIHALDRLVRKGLFIDNDLKTVAAKTTFWFLSDLSMSLTCPQAVLRSQDIGLLFYQPFWRSWFSERLIPWYHFVPLESDLSNDNLIIFIDKLTNETDDGKVAHEIALEGAKARTYLLREIDATIYMYRLLIELAALIQS